MRIFACVLLVAVVAVGCNPQSNPESSEAEAAADSKKKDPKWAISIDGLPDMSGNIISAVTMDGNGKYGLGVSGFRATIGYNKDEPTSVMMFTFEDANVRCVSQDEGATATADGNRAIVGGEVLCYPIDGNFDDAEPASLEGFFELNL